MIGALVSVRAGARVRAQGVSNTIPALLVLAAVLGLWQIMGATGRLPSFLLTPGRIGQEIVELIRTGEAAALLAPSLRRAGIGFLIGASTGLMLGLLSGISRLAQDFTDLPVSLTYPLPKISLLPVVAVWLGFTDSARIAIIALACFYPAYVAAQGAVRGIDPDFFRVAYNCEAGRLRRLWQVVVPAAMPRALAGVQISLGFAFILLFSTEIIGVSDGIGADIFVSYRFGRHERMFAGIVLLGALGWLTTVAFTRIVRWLDRAKRFTQLNWTQLAGERSS